MTDYTSKDTERFNAKINKNGSIPAHCPELGPCWEWTAYKLKTGYGYFSYKHAKAKYAHRVAYEMAFGDIPEGLSVLHKCDHPNCVRPSHLFLGTTQDNIADKISKKRHRSGEGVPNHKLTEADVIIIRQRYATEGISRAKLAGEYGVTSGTIGSVVRNKTWKTLTREEATLRDKPSVTSDTKG